MAGSASIDRRFRAETRPVPTKSRPELERPGQAAAPAQDDRPTLKRPDPPRRPQSDPPERTIPERPSQRVQPGFNRMVPEDAKPTQLHERPKPLPSVLGRPSSLEARAQEERLGRRPPSRAATRAETEPRPARFARGTSPPPDQQARGTSPPPDQRVVDQHARVAPSDQHARVAPSAQHAHVAPSAQQARVAPSDPSARGISPVLDELARGVSPPPDQLARGTAPNDALDTDTHDECVTDAQDVQDDPLVEVLNALSPPGDTIDTSPFERAQPARAQMPTVIVEPHASQHPTQPERRPSSPSVENHVVRNAWHPEHTSSTEQQLLHYQPTDQMWLGCVVSPPTVGASLVIGRFMQPDFTITSPVTKIITRQDGMLIQTTTKNRYFVDNGGATYLVRRLG